MCLLGNSGWVRGNPRWLLSGPRLKSFNIINVCIEQCGTSYRRGVRSDQTQICAIVMLAYSHAIRMKAAYVKTLSTKVICEWLVWLFLTAGLLRCLDLEQITEVSVSLYVELTIAPDLLLSLTHTHRSRCVSFGPGDPSSPLPEPHYRHSDDPQPKHYPSLSRGTFWHKPGARSHGHTYSSFIFLSITFA